MKSNKCPKCETGIIYCVFTSGSKAFQGKIREHCTDCDYTLERGLTRKIKKWIPFLNRRKS